MKKFNEIKEPTYDYITKYLQNLKDEYPFLNLASCGKSVMGKDVPALCMGEGKRRVMYVGGTHANEWITTLFLFRFCENFCESVKNKGQICGFNAQKILSQIKFVVIPCLNPDGTDIFIKGVSACGEFKEQIYDISKFDFSQWTANANGVDLNHNFNADWYALRDYEAKNNILEPSPRRYGGAFPESEPETKALTEFLRKVHFHRLYSFHSQGEEIFYEYGKNTPEKSLFIAKALAGVSGYTLVKNEGHYSSGGLKDWFIEEFKEPAFTIEIGKGKNPLPLEKFDEIYETVEPLAVLGLML
jgi:g-D-glutamyl-meso-diaminopimelate peptidase